MPLRLEISPEKCIGCRSCELACSLANDGELHPDKSRISLISFDDDSKGLPCHLPLTCKQCADAPCLASCPVDAIFRSKNALRMVDIDLGKCIRCGHCVISCPFGAMYYDKQTELPFKCTLCQGEPACAAICPTGAISFVQQRPFSAYPQALYLKAFSVLQDQQRENLRGGA